MLSVSISVITSCIGIDQSNDSKASYRLFLWFDAKIQLCNRLLAEATVRSCQLLRPGFQAVSIPN